MCIHSSDWFRACRQKGGAKNRPFRKTVILTASIEVLIKLLIENKNVKSVLSSDVKTGTIASFNKNWQQF